MTLTSGSAAAEEGAAASGKTMTTVSLMDEKDREKQKHDPLSDGLEFFEPLFPPRKWGYGVVPTFRWGRRLLVKCLVDNGWVTQRRFPYSPRAVEERRGDSPHAVKIKAS